MCPIPTVTLAHRTLLNCPLYTEKEGSCETAGAAAVPGGRGVLVLAAPAPFPLSGDRW